jgi:hypothetical protein
MHGAGAFSDDYVVDHNCRFSVAVHSTYSDGDSVTRFVTGSVEPRQAGVSVW